MPSTPILERFLDWMVLRPSRHVIPRDGLASQWIDVDGGAVELFSKSVDGQTARVPDKDQDASQLSTQEADFQILKFSGSSGRAENTTHHPLDVLEAPGTIWVANPPGYGRSPGRASLRQSWRASVRVYQVWQSNFPDRKPVFSGISLGGTIALCLASRVECGGIIARDMAPISQVIRTRYRSFSRIARALAKHVPGELDVLAAAAKCQAPAVLVTSGKDRVVPISCQNAIVEAYGGPKRVVHSPESGHAEVLRGKAANEYQQALLWLADQLRA